MPPVARNVPGAILVAVLCGLAWMFGGGFSGLLYLLLYVAATVPGLPLGFALFGRDHAAGWIGGALIGYALTAVAVATAVELKIVSAFALLAVWAVVAIATWAAARRLHALATLPAWTRRDTAALLLTLLIVPAIVAVPFARVGETDAEGNRRYRAYFTADFIWHVALLGQMAHLRLPPPDPYAGGQPLHYYWTYFVPPGIASAAAARLMPPPEGILKINALCAGTLFVASIFVVAWCATRRAGPTAAAVLLAVAAASAEGAYAVWDLWSRDRPLSSFRELNVDAITMWFFEGLTIDSLPRSLWYTPQHAGACALGLIPLLAPFAGAATLSGSLLAGLWLAAAVAFSPFLGGAFAVVYGIVALFCCPAGWRGALRYLAIHALASVPVGAAIAWCVANDMLAGAGDSLRIGLGDPARRAPLVTLALAAGPLLVSAIFGFLKPRGVLSAAAIPLAGLVCGLTLFHFVRLENDAVWVGWRAGQVLLVTVPGLAARGLATLWDTSRAAAVVLTLALFAAGLPTTVLDAYNAQDVNNTDMGPGFRWTVVISKAQQEAFEWVQRATHPTATVQMEIVSRERETWSLIPTFARRRMAAGLPISLIPTPDQQQRAARVRRMYETPDARRAWHIARDLRIEYIYVDSAERTHVPAAGLAKFDGHPSLFPVAFENEEVRIYSVAR